MDALSMLEDIERRLLEVLAKYEALKTENAELRARNGELAGDNHMLCVKVGELRAALEDERAFCNAVLLDPPILVGRFKR